MRKVSSFAIFASALAVSSTAAAQSQSGFALEHYAPAERGSEWLASDSLDLRGHMRPALGLVIDWAHDPLVLVNADGTQRAALVHDQVIAHAGGALTLVDRVRLAFDVPLALHSSGDATVASGTSLRSPDGDLRLGVDVRLLGTYGDAITVAAGAQFFVPTGSREAYMSDGTFRVQPHALAAGTIGAFTYAAKVGFEYRPEGGTFAQTGLGSTVLFTASAGARLLGGALIVGPEAFGTTTVTSDDGAFKPRNTPFEVLLGGHYTRDDVRFGLGVGPGLTHGYGAPAWRGVVSVEWAPGARAPKAEETVAPAPASEPPPAPAPEPPVAEAAAAPPAPVADPDRDKDGIVNEVDGCPDVAGRKTVDPKSNGCPLAFVERDRIRITEQVKFGADSAVLDPESDTVLEAVRGVLASHPEIRHLRVEGHSDNAGNAAHNLSLSEARAAAVAKWLVDHGIDASRVASVGLGSTKPLVANDDEAGRRQNRRVEFHIEAESATAPSPAKN